MSYRGRQVLEVSIVVVAVAFVYGMWADFIPSETLLLAEGIITAILTLIMTTVMYLEWKSRGFRTQGGIITKVTQIIMMPCIAAMMIWSAVSHGVPAAYTRLVGKEHYLYAQLQKKRVTTNSRTCEYRLKGNVLDLAFPNFICINERLFYQYKKMNKVILIGKRSMLGFYITDIIRVEDDHT